MIDVNKNYSIGQSARVLSELSNVSITYQKLHYYIQNKSLPSRKVLGTFIISGSDLRTFYEQNFEQEKTVENE